MAYGSDELMDTRIEELADIIRERCEAIQKPREYSDKWETYKAIQRYAEDIARALASYRQRHPEEY